MDKLIPRLNQEALIERFMVEPTHSVLDGSEVGVGKTLVAVEFMLRMGFKRVLIVGIKDTFFQWAERIEAQSDGSVHLRRIDSTKAGKIAFSDMLEGKAGHYFVGSQYLSKQDWERVPTGMTDESGNDLTERHQKKTYAKMPPLDALIYDEVHLVSNRKSNGIGTTRSVPTDWKYAMSATFYGNKFPNTHPICRWLWPDTKDLAGNYIVDPSFIRWRSVWCDTEDRYVGGARPVTMVLGEKEPKGRFVSTLPCYVRIEAVEQPPEPEILYVDLAAEQLDMYTQMEQDGVMWLDAHPGLEPLVASLPISKRTRLRTAALGTMALNEDGDVHFGIDTVSTKLSALRQILDRPEWEDRPVGIYTHSKQFAKVVVARMRRAGMSAVEWSGDVSSKDRDRIKERFLVGDPEYRYIVSVIESFGTGLDGFQMKCNRLIWLSESDSTKDNHQALGRYFRPGGNLSDFKHTKIIARDTIDEGVLQRNRVATLNNRRQLAA